MTAAPQRILLLQLHHLGDVLLTTPTIRATRQAFPAAHIGFVTSPLGAQALAGNPYLDDIIVKPRLRDIYRARYDAVVDMHSVPRTARIVVASRARLRIGLRGRGPRNLAYNKLISREKNAVYMALQKLRMLEPLGVAPAGNNLELEIALTEVDRTSARAVANEATVAISPVAKHDFKQWGADNWAVVADVLAAQGARILITHGPNEEAQASAVASAMRAPAHVQAATTVKQLAALYERSTLWLGNDGGPKHIAAAVKTPTLAVYRRRLGAVWSDLRDDTHQYAINSEADDVKELAREPVIEAAVALWARYGKV